MPPELSAGRGRILPSGGVTPLRIALPVLLLSLLLPWQGQWAYAVVLVVALGIPHGALDVEIGRSLLRARLGPAWFPVFALPYLALVAAVLAFWRLAPETTLAAFLALTVWHFGCEETGSTGLPALAVGGIPVAVPVLLHRAPTAQVLAAFSGLPLDNPPTWLLWSSGLWMIPAGLWLVRTLIHGELRGLVLPAATTVAFVVLPPLSAFTLYFVTVHAPAHTAALIRHPTRAPRLGDADAAWRLALPVTALTVLMGVALWSLTGGEPAVRLVRATFQLLAALTLPHMLLDTWLDRRDAARAEVSDPQARPSLA